MREGERLAARDVALGEIRVSERLRPASKAAVAALASSIEEMGLALTPVALRQTDGGLVLIAGLHRLEAYRRLGRETIWAEIWECSDRWARLAEIDENLAGAELSNLELAQFLAERRRIYEALHPESRRGHAGAVARWDQDATDIVSFASSIAEKRGISERHVRRLGRIGDNLTPQAAELLRRRPAALAIRDLARLSELPPSAQSEAARSFSARLSATLKEAIDSAEPGRAPVEQLPAEERAFRDLRERFDRAPAAARRRFVQHLVEHHREAVLDTLRAGEG